MAKYEIIFHGKIIDLIEAESIEDAQDITNEKTSYKSGRTATYYNSNNKEGIIIAEEGDDDITDFIDWAQGEIEINELEPEEATRRMLLE